MKRGWREREKGWNGGGCDWADIPEEILVGILVRIEPGDPVRSVLEFACVCRSWNAAMCSGLFWREACEKKWRDKVYIPKDSRELLNVKNDPKEAYRTALIDSKRTFLTIDEITSFTWSFRFKAAAGEHWTESDPWWQSGPNSTNNTRSHHHNHQQQQEQQQQSLRSRAHPSAQTPSRTSPSSPSATTSRTTAAAVERAAGEQQQQRTQEEEGVQGARVGKPIVVRFGADGSVSGRGQMHIPQQFRWSFVQTACGRTDAPLGSFVRVNQFPAYVVSRHERNWGFIMQSCWVVLTSFEMPPRGGDELLEDEALSVTVEYQASEAMAYNARVTRFYFNEMGELDEMEEELDDWDGMYSEEEEDEHDEAEEVEEDDEDEDEVDAEEEEDEFDEIEQLVVLGAMEEMSVRADAEDLEGWTDDSADDFGEVLDELGFEDGISGEDDDCLSSDFE